MKTLTIILSAILYLCSFSAFSAESGEQPVQVDACELMTNTIAYHRKLVRVEARVSRGFENFSLQSDACSDLPHIWLEYGGPQPAEVIYCCSGDSPSPPNGKDPLVIDGIRTSLVRNTPFRDFERKTKQLRRGETVRAVIIGRIFAKKAYEKGNEEDLFAGFGHFGMSSLLVIQRVERVR